MPEQITAEEAATLTGFPIGEIQLWVRRQNITSYPLEKGGYLIDVLSLNDYIMYIQRAGINKLYLQLMLDDKKEEINETIALYDDYLLCLRSLKMISPLLKRIIDELSTLLTNNDDKKIFGEITSGTPILKIAQHYDISYIAMCTRYKKILAELEKEAGFLSEYKKTLAGFELEVDRLEIESRNKDFELKQLHKKTFKSNVPSDTLCSLFTIPAEAVKKLRKPINSLTLSPYIYRRLAEMDIRTIEDLLRLTKRKGFHCLFEMAGYGKIAALEQLKFQLEKHQIIDREGHCSLYDYLIV